MSDDDVLLALEPLDRLYPQGDDAGAVRHQLMRQLALPRPYDLDTVNLAEYKGLVPVWRDWSTVTNESARLAELMADAVATGRQGWNDLQR
jgi:hypothetical protein